MGCISRHRRDPGPLDMTVSEFIAKTIIIISITLRKADHVAIFVSCLLWLKCNGPSAMNASLLISYMTSVKNQRKSGEYHIRSRPILSSSLHFSWSSCTVCSSKSSANVQQSLCLGASNLCANGESDLLFIYRLLNSLDGKQ